jgi:hypothetical protein
MELSDRAPLQPPPSPRAGHYHPHSDPARAGSALSLRRRVTVGGARGARGSARRAHIQMTRGVALCVRACGCVAEEGEESDAAASPPAGFCAPGAGCVVWARCAPARWRGQEGWRGVSQRG